MGAHRWAASSGVLRYKFTFTFMPTIALNSTRRRPRWSCASLLIYILMKHSLSLVAREQEWASEQESEWERERESTRFNGEKRRSLGAGNETNGKAIDLIKLTLIWCRAHREWIHAAADSKARILSACQQQQQQQHNRALILCSLNSNNSHH